MANNGMEGHPATPGHELLLESRDITDLLNDFTRLIAGHLAAAGTRCHVQ